MARLLVVDDDPDLRDLIVQRIARDGHQVLAADSGPAAMALAKEHPVFDAVVLDVGMPGMNGFELLDILRRHRPDLPALILTVLWTADIQEQIHACGAHYLAKPFTAVSLRDAVHRLVTPAAAEGYG